MFNVSTSYAEELEYKTYNVGIYLRLSRDDGEENVSESIINQKEYLTKYIGGQANWLLTDIYIDDRIYRD